MDARAAMITDPRVTMGYLAGLVRDAPMMAKATPRAAGPAHALPHNFVPDIGQPNRAKLCSERVVNPGYPRLSNVR